MAVVYIGGRDADGCYVACQSGSNEKRLPSPSGSGFAWGYNGQGPSATALAILIDAFDMKHARVFEEPFIAEVVSTWTQDMAFECPVEELWAWMTRQERARPDWSSSASKT